MPSPKCALRWLAFSPVPSHTTFELFGSTTTQQSVNEPPSSNTGVKVVPRLVVFHNPPNAVAMYHVLDDFGSIAMSWTRPVWMAGPMPRNSSPFSTSAVRWFVPAERWRALVLTVAKRAAAAAAAISVLNFMGRDSVRIRVRGQLSGWIFEALSHRGVAGRHGRGRSRLVRDSRQAAGSTRSAGRRAAGASTRRGRARDASAGAGDRGRARIAAGAPDRRRVLGPLAEPVRSGRQLPIRQPPLERGVSPVRDSGAAGGQQARTRLHGGRPGAELHVHFGAQAIDGLHRRHPSREPRSAPHVQGAVRSVRRSG